jgi:uncharacterized membrane protein YeiB
VPWGKGQNKNHKKCQKHFNFSKLPQFTILTIKPKMASKFISLGIFAILIEYSANIFLLLFFAGSDESVTAFNEQMTAATAARRRLATTMGGAAIGAYRRRCVPIEDLALPAGLGAAMLLSMLIMMVYMNCEQRRRRRREWESNNNNEQQQCQNQRQSQRG